MDITSNPEPLTVLSQDEVREIHEAALDVLAGCGVYVDHPRALEHLAAKARPRPGVDENARP
ncbi:MAG: hypothetical protein K6U08_10030, partial [Firmicutes bacterium]|nr:hypothetical protein [Bacillota bacterium]